MKLTSIPLDILLATPVLLVEKKLTGRTDFDPYEEGFLEKMSTIKLLSLAFTEELLFRVICPQLIKSYLPFGTGYVPEIISTFLFGIVHLFTPKPSFTTLFATTVIGFKFNDIYKNLGFLPATIAHAAHNLSLIQQKCFAKNRDKLNQIELTLNRNKKILKQMGITLNNHKLTAKKNWD